MKLKEVYAKLKKEELYFMYERIVYKTKDYENITRSKMLDEILKEMSKKDFVYQLCTYKELDFLIKLKDKKINKKDLEKYSREIANLYEKFILDMNTMEVYEEQKTLVDSAIKSYEENKQNKRKMDDFFAILIGFVKVYVELATKALESIMCSLTKVSKEGFNALLGSPLVHFYCNYYYEDIPSLGEEEFIYYRDYEMFMDDLKTRREEFSNIGTMQIEPIDYIDIFYYDFPISKPKVKKAYDKFYGTVDGVILLFLLQVARVFNDKDVLKDAELDEEYKKILLDALEEIPSAALNGATPKEYGKTKEEVSDTLSKMDNERQTDACLSKKDADTYYKLYFALLEYTNDLYKISDIKKIYKQKYLNPTVLKPIDEYLWHHKEIIDKFIKENKYKFNNEELDIVKGFKTAYTSNFLTICGYEKEYTKIYDAQNNKVYMMKGVNDNFDNVVNVNELPMVVGMTLLMFKDKIIYSGLFNAYSIDFGDTLKQMAIEESNKAMKYYHL